MFNIPIRLLMVTVSIVVALTAGTLSFVPLYIAAERAAHATAGEFAVVVSDGIAVTVTPFFSSAQTSLDGLLAAIEFRGIDFRSNVSVWNWLSHSFLSTGFIASMYFDDGSWVSVSRGNTVVNLNTSNRHLVLTVNGNFEQGLVTSSLRRVSDLSQATIIQTTRSTYNPLTRPFWVPLRAKRTWTEPFVDTAGAVSVLMAGAPILTGQNRGIVGLRLDSATVVSFLQSVTISRTGRVILISGSVFVGGNFDESPVTKSANGTSYIKDIDMIRQPTVAEVVQERGNDIMTCIAPCRFTVGSERGLRYVRVVAITDPYGLDLRVVVIIPAEDFLSNIWHGSEVGLGSSAAAIVGLVLIAVIALHFLLRPLSALCSRLNQCASLHPVIYASPSSGWQSWWTLEEVTLMEDAVMRLTEQLRRVRSFLPQSLVDQLDAQYDDAVSSDDVSVRIDGSTDGEHYAQQSKEERVAITAALEDRGHSYSEAAGLSLGGGQINIPNDAWSDDEVADDDGSVVDRSSSEKNRSSSRRHPQPFDPLAALAATEHSSQVEVKSLVASRKVSVVSLKLMGAIDLLQSLGPAKFSSLLEQATRFVLMVTKRHKGVVEWVSGDHFILSFNASTACSQHCLRAAATTMALTRSPVFAPPLDIHEPLQRFRGVAVGVASGTAACGYFGCERLKRFGIIGPCVNDAKLLMDVAIKLNVSNMVSASFLDLVRSEFDGLHCALLDTLSLEKRTGASPVSSLQVVSTLIPYSVSSSLGNSEFACAGDEVWKASVYATQAVVNSIFEKLAKGDIADAKQLAVRASKKKSDDPAISRALDACATVSS